MKALVWPVATYGGESWTLRKNEETGLDDSEMKGLRDSAGFMNSKENKWWILNKTGVKRELLDTVKARKLAYYGHAMRKQGSCMEKGQDTPPVEETIRMTEGRNKWRKYVDGVAKPRIEDG